MTQHSLPLAATARKAGNVSLQQGYNGLKHLGFAYDNNGNVTSDLSNSYA